MRTWYLVCNYIDPTAAQVEATAERGAIEIVVSNHGQIIYKRIMIYFRADIWLICVIQQRMLPGGNRITCVMYEHFHWVGYILKYTDPAHLLTAALGSIA